MHRGRLVPVPWPGRTTTMTTTAITMTASAPPTTMSRPGCAARRRAARSRSSRIRSRAAARPGLAHVWWVLPTGTLPGHRPNSSTVWSTAVKPASAATCSAQRSTARPSTSTLVPQLRQMR